MFLALAREGKLDRRRQAAECQPSHGGAAGEGSWKATVGARLFDRLPDRFALTAGGRRLARRRAERWNRPPASIHRRSAGLNGDTLGTVRISAGEAMTDYLARNLPRLRHNLNCIEFELVASHTLANLSRREADLMIRDKVPDLATIVTASSAAPATPSTATVDLAIGGTSRDALRKMNWIGFDEEHAYMPGQAWLHDLLGRQAPGHPHQRLADPGTRRSAAAPASRCCPAISPTPIRPCAASARP